MSLLSHLIGVTVCVSGFLTPVPALAIDGVIEISQARATLGGISFNDAPGFPISITEPGSYRLMSDLSVDEATLVIDISSSYVTLDLNGFSIIGPVKCDPGTSNCTPAGVGAATGVSVQNSAHFLTIKNGMITGMGGSGIWCANSDSCTVENLTVSHNYQVGIAAGWRSRVSNCRVQANRTTGIRAGGGTIIDSNSITLNGGVGLLTREGVIVTSNAFSLNATTEIDMDSSITAIGGNSFRPLAKGNWFDNSSKMTEISPNLCIDGSAPYTNCTGL